MIPRSLSCRHLALAAVVTVVLALPRAARAQQAAATADAADDAPVAARPPPSAGAREHSRLLARVDAITEGAEMYDDGSLDLSPAQRRAVAALDCPRALAVAAMTPEERAAELAQIPDPEDPDLGYEERNWAQSERRRIEDSGIDDALPRSLSCRRAVDRARVHLALGADLGLVFLVEAVRERQPGATQLEAGLSDAQRPLLALLREMDGDFSRARAPSLEVLLRMLTLTVRGPSCTASFLQGRALAEAQGEDASARPAQGFVLVSCSAGWMEFHSSWSFPVVNLIAHVGPAEARVVDRLRDGGLASNEIVWGELVRGTHSVGSILAIELEIGAGYPEQPPEVASALLLVCSGTTLRCRRVDLGFGERRARWALEAGRLALLDPVRFGVLGSVEVERWIAREAELVTDPPRSEPPPRLLPGRSSWEYRELDEVEGCWFTVVDPTGPLNVRARASAGSEIRGTLPIGAVVRAAESTPGWVRIEAPLAGWLHRGGLVRTCLEAIEERLARGDESDESDEDDEE